jgi:hypothetical protein
LAEVVYAAIHANPYRKDNGKSVADMFPQLFEDDDDYEEPDPISEEDRQQLLADMAAWQQQLDQQNKSDEE